MSQQQPITAAASRTAHAAVEAFEPEWGVIGLDFEMDRDMAQTVYWVADEASVERSDYLGSAIRYELRRATERDEPKVGFSVAYHDEGWRRWLAALADEETPYFDDRRRAYLEEFGDLIAGL